MRLSTRVDRGLNLLCEVRHLAFGLKFVCLRFYATVIHGGRFIDEDIHSPMRWRGLSYGERERLIGIYGVMPHVGCRGVEAPLMHGLQYGLFELLARMCVGQCTVPDALVGNAAVAVDLERNGNTARHAFLKCINRVLR